MIAQDDSRSGTETKGCEQEFCFEEVDRFSRTYGESFYVFDENRLRYNFARLKSAFIARYPQTRIAYSYKTNYTPAICRVVDEMGGYAEVVSEMEYDLARRIGVGSGRIIYNGPYKSLDSLQDALRSRTIVNLDSLRDYENVSGIARGEPEKKFSVGVRCNFEIPGKPRSRFGFDVHGAEFRAVIEGILRSSNVTLSGLHCHFPYRDLHSFGVRARHMLEIAREVFPEAPPAFLDLGGGLFGELPESLGRMYEVKPPELAEYAEVIGDLFTNEYGSTDRAPVLFIEPGTALVADAVKFYTKVVGIKEVGGSRIATVSGSIFNISPYARTVNLPVRRIGQPDVRCLLEGKEEYDIAGYTCIEGDYLTKKFPGPLQIGDFLEYTNVGSYSIVMKPPFILPNVPILRMSEQGRELSVIKHKETGDDIFHTFSGA